MHSGAYFLTSRGLRMQLCAQAGVRKKFVSALSPMSKAEMDTAEVTKARIPVSVAFILGKVHKGTEAIV